MTQAPGKTASGEGAVGSRFAWTFSAASVVLVAAILVGLGVWGSSERWNPDADRVVLVVDRSSELPRAWERAGLRGAVLVSASRDLGFQSVPFGAVVTVPAAYPFPAFDYRDAILKYVARDNYVWVASQRGLFRTVDYVLPPEEFERRVTEGRALGYSGISADGSAISPNNNGYLRHIAASFPQIHEPVVLGVDASYFTSATAESLKQALDRAALDVRVITLDRALDDTATTDAARARLDDFGRMVEATP